MAGPGDASAAGFDSFREELARVQARINGELELRTWRLSQGEGPPRAIDVRAGWNPGAGPARFEREYEVPARVCGVPVAGEPLELIVFALVGGELLVDGVPVVSEPYWLQTEQAPQVLRAAAAPGERIALALHTRGGDGLGVIGACRLRYPAVSEVLFDLELLEAQLMFSLLLARRATRSDWVRAWECAAAALDTAVLRDCRWDAWREMAARVRASLAPFGDAAKAYTAHCIAHAHIDMNWLWPWRETVAVCLRDFATMDRLMEEHPDLRFSQSQVSVYATVRERDPSLWQRILARVAQGRWEVTASSWVENDKNLVGPESLARHLLLARAWTRDVLGCAPRLQWEPDTFGHAATLPQLLAQAGVEFYYHCRTGPEVPFYWWEGLDGSRVLVYHDARWYSGDTGPRRVIESVHEAAACHGLRDGLTVWGVGDHGGGATVRGLEKIRRIDAAPFVPRAVCSRAEAFFTRVQAAAPDLPVHRGELNTVFEGCYSSHADLKKLNREGENLLVAAEAAGVAAAVCTGRPWPEGDAAALWQTHLVHQFHDILGGCTTGDAAREAREALEANAARVRDLAAGALAALAAQVDTRAGGAGPRLVVFNPLPWPRTAPVLIAADRLAGSPGACVDDAGRRLPVQAAEGGYVVLARDVPPLGVRVFAFEDGGVEAHDARDYAVRQAGALCLENGLVRVRVHPLSGAIDSLVDLRSGKEFAPRPHRIVYETPPSSGTLNVLEVCHELPADMSAWRIGEFERIERCVRGAEVVLREAGPLRGVIEVRRRVRDSTVRARVVLYAGLDRVFVENDIDWCERGDPARGAPLLRAAFTPELDATEATFEIPFAGLSRPANGKEVPALGWADLSDGAYGLSVLNDGRYGHRAQGATLTLTLLRAAYCPDLAPDVGRHLFTHALYPHRGSWREGGTVRAAAELNQPVLWTLEDAHAGGIVPGRGLLCVSPQSVGVSAVKPAREQDGAGKTVVVRLYEPCGTPVTARVEVEAKVVRARRADVLERPAEALPCKGNTVEIPLRRYEIATVLLDLAAP